MKIDLKKYTKNQVKLLDTVIKSVNIERKHKVFLDENKINLSHLVRDLLDRLMRDFTKK